MILTISKDLYNAEGLCTLFRLIRNTDDEYNLTDEVTIKAVLSSGTKMLLSITTEDEVKSDVINSVVNVDEAIETAESTKF